MIFRKVLKAEKIGLQYLHPCSEGEGGYCFTHMCVCLSVPNKIFCPLFIINYSFWVLEILIFFVSKACHIVGSFSLPIGCQLSVNVDFWFFYPKFLKKI